MGADTSAKLKLSVWRDFNPSRALIQWRQESSEVHLLSADRDLQQEVYSWQMKEDPFGGVPDDAIRANLHALLMERFASSKSPSDRRVDLLQDFISEAKRVVRDGQSEWTGSQAAPDDDEDAPYMLNPLLALALHLDWLRASFSGQPGISVSIR
ncbi:hypothetical protein GCM10022268_24150 [Sphingomonas cynarae]|uniref:Uncharacterized protein n=1 Tax=Sphingomonas cynarae TaxID=930197 RepID=A0ABP7E5J6_9SPHN